MAKPRITVRMYQGLLGDCFLIRLFKDEGADDRSRVADAHILIDCGILQNVPDEKARMLRVGEDIKQACGGKLDLLVVTHMHWDHLSGFHHAWDILFGGDPVTVGAFWLAWTENPKDKQAKALRDKFDETLRTLALGLQHFQLSAAPDSKFLDEDEAEWLEGFLGPFDQGMGASERMTTQKILDRLKAKFPPPPENYLEPGQVRNTPGAASLRTYVLGPPRNEQLLFKDRPSTTPERKETYLDTSVNPEGEEASVYSSTLRAAEIGRHFQNDDRKADPLDTMPFSRRYQRLKEDWLLKEMTKPDKDAPVAYKNLWNIRKTYLSKENDWQQIRSDWQGAFSQLAIDLNSDTNNSSLVLAFEVEPGGDVLLFAGDAQVGNWLSWHKQPYPAGDAPGGAEYSAENLLNRVVLYKVGHHASHNATLRKEGLEMMTSDRLTAMIPVVEDVAQKRRWKMPFEDLYERLKVMTKGRILRGDQPPDPEWDAAFRARVRTDPAPDPLLGSAWIEYDVC